MGQPTDRAIILKNNKSWEVVYPSAPVQQSSDVENAQDLPPADVRQSVGSSGELPSDISTPSEFFSADEKGAVGKAPKVPRDARAKNDELTVITPLEIKEDAYCVIQLVPNVGSPTTTTQTFEKFLLTGVNRNHRERSQVFETFKRPILYLMDASPTEATFSGHFVTGVDVNNEIQENLFMNFFEKYLRGTKAAETEVRAFFHYLNKTVIGYVLTLGISESSDRPGISNFNFGVYVEDIKYIG